MKPRTAVVLRALQAADGDWVCGRSLAHARCGGWRAAARLHELREDGWVLEKRVCRCDQCRWSADRAREAGRRPARIYAWRLVSAPRERAA